MQTEKVLSLFFISLKYVLQTPKPKLTEDVAPIVNMLKPNTCFLYKGKYLYSEHKVVKWWEKYKVLSVGEIIEIEIEETVRRPSDSDFHHLIFYHYVDRDGNIWQSKEFLGLVGGEPKRRSTSDLLKDNMHMKLWINPRKLQIGDIINLEGETVCVSSVEKIPEIVGREFYYLKPLPPQDLVPQNYKYYYDKKTGLLFKEERELYNEVLWLESTNLSL